MADNDRVVFPDELAEAKSKAAESAGSAAAGETNSAKQAQETTKISPHMLLRNMIQAPFNCPEGYRMDEDGNCREIF